MYMFLYVKMNFCKSHSLFKKEEPCGWCKVLNRNYNLIHFKNWKEHKKCSFLISTLPHFSVRITLRNRRLTSCIIAKNIYGDSILWYYLILILRPLLATNHVSQHAWNMETNYWRTNKRQMTKTYQSLNKLFKLCVTSK